MIVEYDDEALQELRETIIWYNGFATHLANDFIAKYDSALSVIMMNVNAWPPIGEGARRYQMDRFPYKIIYKSNAERLRIIAVVHNKRKPGYWRSRLKH